MTGLETRSSWLAPSGQGYDIFFGGPVPRAASVALTSSKGDVGAEGKVVKGWYVIYITTERFGAFDHLSLFDTAGKVVNSSPW